MNWYSMANRKSRQTEGRALKPFLGFKERRVWDTPIY